MLTIARPPPDPLETPAFSHQRRFRQHADDFASRPDRPEMPGIAHPDPESSAC
jgi:hypothetical protein